MSNDIQTNLAYFMMIKNVHFRDFGGLPDVHIFANLAVKGLKRVCFNFTHYNSVCRNGPIIHSGKTIGFDQRELVSFAVTCE